MQNKFRTAQIKKETLFTVQTAKYTGTPKTTATLNQDVSNAATEKKD
jgi:hypothetical protein